MSLAAENKEGKIITWGTNLRLILVKTVENSEKSCSKSLPQPNKLRLFIP